MRDLHTLDRWRRMDRHVLELWGWVGDGTCGMFIIPSPVDQRPIAAVASTAGGWDHVSVSRKNRCPNWQEMEFIAGLFFADDETAMQLHVPAADHINNHPYCLHWWRPIGAEIPRPPSIFVGVQDAGVVTPATLKAAREAAGSQP